MNIRASSAFIFVHQRLSICLLALALPAGAHMVSISTGEARVDGAQVHYQLRMPWYEVAHVVNPERTLLRSIEFSSSGVKAAVQKSSCRKLEDESALLCEEDLVFPAPVDVLDVRSSFHTVTVPNHVHLLRAVMGERTDQVVLDLSFPAASLRFRPPAPLEVALQQTTAGALRAAGGLAQLLFLAALVIAARTRRELMLLTSMFVAGEIASALFVPGLAWQPAPRFVESAAALTIAYLAVETLLLPEAGQRWLVVVVLGLLHGLYFALFLTGSEYHAGYVLSGVVAAELILIAVLAWVWTWLARALHSLRPVRAASAALLVTGLGWFFLRLKG
ncbi:MAG: HupE/UreJ family protein [Acidobacteriia bacterium]|nr:HupE/UreJ family protein [Terriglobia bacterium]